MEVSLSQSALDDPQAIIDWYQQEKVPEVGQRLVNEILNRLEQISDHPSGGRMVPEMQNPDLRELIHSPFRIVYLVENDSCSVVRVWRSERLLRLE